MTKKLAIRMLLILFVISFFVSSGIAFYNADDATKSVSNQTESIKENQEAHNEKVPREKSSSCVSLATEKKEVPPERKSPPLAYYHGERVLHVKEINSSLSGPYVPVYARIADFRSEDACVAYSLVDVWTNETIYSAMGDGEIYDNPDREKLLREADRTGEAIYLYGKVISFDNGNLFFAAKKVFRKEEVVN